MELLLLLLALLEEDFVLQIFFLYRFSNKGYSYYLDGDRANVLFMHNGLCSGKTSFTAEVWYHPKSLSNSGFDTIWSSGTASSGSSGYNQILLVYQNGSTLYFYWTGSNHVSSSNIFNELQWYHIAVGWGGSSDTFKRVWINGNTLSVKLLHYLWWLRRYRFRK